MTEEYILKVKVNFDLSLEDVLKIVDQKIQEGGTHLISTTNPEFVVDAQKDLEFRKIINGSLLSIPDGSGLIFARKFMENTKKMPRNFFFPIRAFLSGVALGLGTFLSNQDFKPTRGREMIYDLCKLAEDRGYTVFFLGGWEKDKLGRLKKNHGAVAKKAAEKLRQKYPNLKVAGYNSDYSYQEEDDEKTINVIHDCMEKNQTACIDMLFVAYNHIRQEKWIDRNAWKIPAKVCVGVGGTLDYISGNYKSPGKIVEKFNLEWLYKLIMQPWRIKRIFKAFPTFPLFVYINTLRKPEIP